MSRTETVRSARDDEAAAVAALVTAAGLPTLGLDQAWATVVADDTDGLAGVAALERHGPPGAPAFLLRSVAVRADRRGTGLGAALVTAALDAADGGAPAGARPSVCSPRPPPATSTGSASRRSPATGCPPPCRHRPS